MLSSIKKYFYGNSTDLNGTDDDSNAIGVQSPTTKGIMQETTIKVNDYTDNADQAWEFIKNSVIKECVIPLELDTPIHSNKVRFVCISDTHSKIDKMLHSIPAGDVLIHTGDFTDFGSEAEVSRFSNFLETIHDKFKYKFNWKKKKANKDPRLLLKNCIYLEDSYVQLFGLKIYGAPWQPIFGEWAFNLNRGQELLNKWNMIPGDTDILLTHGPAMGFGDIVRGGYHVGCCELFSTIRERVKPKIHVFGHIHEDYGAWTDGTTAYINASTCSLRMKPENPPVIFDLDLPEGVNKE